MEEYIEACYCQAINNLKVSKTDFLDMTLYEFSLLHDHYIENFKSESNIKRDVFLDALSYIYGESKKIKPFFDTNELEEINNNKSTLEDFEKFAKEVENNQEMKENILNERNSIFGF